MSSPLARALQHHKAQAEKTAEQRRAEERRIELAKRGELNLLGFTELMWPVLEPARPFVNGWAIGAVAEHLQAVSAGQVLRLLINVPPGMMKSLETCVFWPAYEWGPLNMPGLRYLTTSYRGDYADRDARKTRQLVDSDLYQQVWGNRVRITRGGETSFENSAKGGREAVPYRSLTGGRGDRVIIDDPHSTETAESDAERETATRIFLESVPSRINDAKTSAIVVIMQRLHENDVSGTALARDLGYTHLMLPMEFEAERKCRTYIGGKLFFEDPRKLDGELLFPERFPPEWVAKQKTTVGAYAWAGQYQQRPSPRGGKMFKRSMFKLVNVAPADTRDVRHWDIADSEEDLVNPDPDYTAGLRLGFSQSTRGYYIKNIQRVRKEAPEVRKLIKATAVLDGPDVEISLPQDPGGAGKGRGRDYIRMLAGFNVHVERETGSKVVRAEPVQSQAEGGNVYIVRGPADQPEPDWIEPFFAEIEKFPSGAHKDQVDALSGAFARLIGDAVFAEDEANFVVEARRIPSHWERAFTIDFDAGRFACIWGARDPQTDVIYLYDEYRVQKAHLAVHKEAVVGRGEWIPGLFNPVGRKRKKADGLKFVDQLTDRLELYTIEIDDEAAVTEVAGRLSSGRLRVFEHLSGWRAEYRQYQRDDKDQLADKNDHLMKATALLVMHFTDVAVTEGFAAHEERPERDTGERDPHTGY